ncbi:MAG: serine protease [Elusimicrobia bacterium]|nr:serine protease [Elusimicrobiota bacterium]
MRTKWWLGAALLAFTQATAWSQAGPRVIYGDDDRIDLYQVQDPRLLKLADSTAALFKSSDVFMDQATQQARLATRPYGEVMKLCPEEPFREQEKGAFCSGSLVAPNVIMTAGHCVATAESCAKIKFVFGFAIKAAGQLPRAVPASEVYGCGKLLGRLQENRGADWALVQLDRPVSGHSPLALGKGEPANQTALFVIGHPAGLPAKVAGGAWVRDASPKGFFVANLDTYGGNSGSAVFNARTGLVEGILVRGENDYVWKGSCRVSNKCASDACRGEDVTKLSAVIPNLPREDGAETPRASPVVQALRDALRDLPERAPDFDSARP